MEQKLQQIFNFLVSNRSYNLALQKRYKLNAIGNVDSRIEKLILFLYDTVNTQSQPKIDNVAKFFQFIYKNKEQLLSFDSFVKLLGRENDISNFQNLFYGLRKQDGWGDKTAALFTKNIHLIHNIYKDPRLVFWDDVPEIIQPSEKFFLPVDAVIIAVFNKLDNKRNWNFKNINKVLQDHYRSDEMEVWDDLWFWGFINQKGSGNNRVLEWNLNKYWVLSESDKIPTIIDEIEIKSIEFRSILNNK